MALLTIKDIYIYVYRLCTNIAQMLNVFILKEMHKLHLSNLPKDRQCMLGILLNLITIMYTKKTFLSVVACRHIAAIL